MSQSSQTVGIIMLMSVLHRVGGQQETRHRTVAAGYCAATLLDVGARYLLDALRPFLDVLRPCCRWRASRRRGLAIDAWLSRAKIIARRKRLRALSSSLLRHPSLTMAAISASIAALHLVELGQCRAARRRR